MDKDDDSDGDIFYDMTAMILMTMNMIMIW